MEFDFEDRHLIDLYTHGKSKKYKFIDNKMARLFVERINRIEAASVISDLYTPSSMRFERLQGKEDIFSISINMQHRIEFKINFSDDLKTTGKVLILDVTKHYE